MLLGKEKPDRFEVFNDYNHNLINLFRCMRDRPLAFIRELGFLPLNARDDFFVLKRFFQKEEFTNDFLEEELELTSIMLPELKAEEVRELYTKVSHDHDLRRAVMFLKLIRYSYSSGGKSFICQPFSVRSLFSLIQALSIRCENVVIENQDFEKLIRHYDRPDGFIYCDPPYYSSEYIYDCEFSAEDHTRLHTVLMEAKGRFLLSYNDCEEIRQLYEGCAFFDFRRIHSMVQRYEVGKEFPELLIANYDILEKVKSKPLQVRLSDLDDEDDVIDYEKILREGIISC